MASGFRHADGGLLLDNLYRRGLQLMANVTLFLIYAVSS